MNRKISSGSDCFIIAEVGVNHNGDMQLARELVRAAASTGADAVKFQTFKSEYLVSKAAPKAEYQKKTSAADESQYEMLRRLELSEEAHHELKELCRENGIIFLSTPFDDASVELLARLDVTAFKLSSGEVTNLPFLKNVASHGKPVILSTGMAYLDEVRAAVDAIKATGNDQLILLHCVSNYPADPADANLKAIQSLAEHFSLPVGFSDHTPGIVVAPAAVALGACVIEKHLTLSCDLPGPDHRASLEPGDFKAMVQAIRTVESALGDGVKRPVQAELVNIPIGRKSLHWSKSLRSGSFVRPEDLSALRPGNGISPAELESLLNKRLARDVSQGEMVCRDDFECLV